MQDAWAENAKAPERLPAWVEGQLRRFFPEKGERGSEWFRAQEAIVLMPGEILSDRFKVLQLLGFGTTGAVYRVLDSTSGAERAVKVILPALVDSPGMEARITSVMRSVQNLRDERIAPVYDLGEDRGRGVSFLTMPYVRGNTLRQLLTKCGGRLPRDFATRLLVEICDALAYAHRSTVHRNLKPQNILVQADGTPLVLDFSLAATLNPEWFHAASIALGTDAYLAPEQKAPGGGSDARSDVFAFGVIARELFSYRSPGEPPASPFKPLPGIPEEMGEIFARCLYPQPEHRYASAEEVAGDLRRAVSKSLAVPTVTADGTSLDRKNDRRKRFSRTVFTAFLCGTVGLLCLIFFIYEEQIVSRVLNVVMTDSSSGEAVGTLSQPKALQTEKRLKPVIPEWGNPPLLEDEDLFGSRWRFDSKWQDPTLISFHWGGRYVAERPQPPGSPHKSSVTGRWWMKEDGIYMDFPVALTHVWSISGRHQIHLVISGEDLYVEEKPGKKYIKLCRVN